MLIHNRDGGGMGKMEELLFGKGGGWAGWVYGGRKDSGMKWISLPQVLVRLHIV